MKYSFDISGKRIEGELRYGEIILIKSEFVPNNAKFEMENNFTINNQMDYSNEIYGGEVGILLDGRGRPFNFNVNTNNRTKLLQKWSDKTNEFPITEMLNSE